MTSAGTTMVITSMALTVTCIREGLHPPRSSYSVGCVEQADSRLEPVLYRKTQPAGLRVRVCSPQVL